MNDKELEIKLRMFERLSQKGFLQSMQRQMRTAITEELNDCHKQTDRTVANDGDVEDIEVKPIKESEDKDWDPLAKVSSIANWEKQIRYELEIDREIQIREIQRQREKLKNECRKLDERDKCLRIELNARERKVRIREEEVQRSFEDLNEKSAEIEAKEELINTIVNEKIKTEMKEEIEKLKKKFNELEINKLNLIKREEKIKEVEQRLHSQVQIVKEKIDNKRLSEIELAKSRKDLEIIRKENEVLRQRVDSMEDYGLTQFENKSLKSELNAIKECLKNKSIEYESEREKLEKVIKQSDEKVLNLRMDLRKCEQELLILKQKHQGDIDQYDNKLEQLNNQLKQSTLSVQQLRHKNQLLSQEIISSQNRTQKLLKCNQISNNNLSPTDDQNKGCHICNHTIKTMEEMSVEFLVSQKYGLDSDKHNINEQNLDLQSIPLNANQENNSKNMKQMPTEVPLSDKSMTTHVIQHNTCAKHKQNGIQLKQTIEDNKQTIDRKSEDIKSETNILNNNNVIKHKVVEDYNKDISDSFEW